MTSFMAPRTGKNEVGLEMDDRCLQDVGKLGVLNLIYTPVN